MNTITTPIARSVRASGAFMQQWYRDWSSPQDFTGRTIRNPGHQGVEIIVEGEAVNPSKVHKHSRIQLLFAAPLRAMK